MDYMVELYTHPNACDMWCWHCPRAMKAPMEPVSQLQKKHIHLIHQVLEACDKDSMNPRLNISESIQNWKNIQNLLPPYDYSLLLYHAVGIWATCIDDLEILPGLFHSGTDLSRVEGHLALNMGNQPKKIIFDKIEQLQRVIDEYIIKLWQGKYGVDPLSVNIALWSNALNKRDFAAIIEEKDNILTLLYYLLFWKNSYQDAWFWLEKRFIDASIDSKFWLGVLGFRSNDHLSIKYGSYRFVSNERLKTPMSNQYLLNIYQNINDLTISIFPDKVMVHHDTADINNPFLWFTYEEFTLILLKKGWTFREKVNTALAQRIWQTQNRPS